MVFPRAAHKYLFIIPNKPQFGKISMKTTMTTGRSSENGGRFDGGHDGMANLCKPITAHDFHVRYNKHKLLTSSYVSHNYTQLISALSTVIKGISEALTYLY